MLASVFVPDGGVAGALTVLFVEFAVAVVDEVFERLVFGFGSGLKLSAP